MGLSRDKVPERSPCQLRRTAREASKFLSTVAVDEDMGDELTGCHEVQREVYNWQFHISHNNIPDPWRMKTLKIRLSNKMCYSTVC